MFWKADDMDRNGFNTHAGILFLKITETIIKLRHMLKKLPNHDTLIKRMKIM